MWRAVVTIASPSFPGRAALLGLGLECLVTEASLGARRHGPVLCMGEAMEALTGVPNLVF